MGLYEGIKDVAKVVQQADNVELYRNLIDLSAQALDMQEEISMLKRENEELKKRKDISMRVVRHTDPYITIKDDELELYYCSNCYDSNNLLIQLNCMDNGSFTCPNCKMSGRYSKEKEQEASQVYWRNFTF